MTSPEVLERVVRNCLTAQLADRDLAISTHAQLLHGAMAPPDRLYDGRLTVTLNKTGHHDQLRVTIRPKAKEFEARVFPAFRRRSHD